MPLDFDIHALHAAVDSQREARGLSWSGVARQVNRGVTTGRPIAATTISRMRDKPWGIEGDTVLQVLLWLGRTPESFVPGGPPGAPLRRPGRGQVLRWDPRLLHAALDAERRRRSLTWREVAVQAGVAAGALAALGGRSRVSFPGVMRITGWLGQPAAAFTRPFPRWSEKRGLLA